MRKRGFRCRQSSANRIEPVNGGDRQGSSRLLICNRSFFRSPAALRYSRSAGEHSVGTSFLISPFTVDSLRERTPVPRCPSSSGGPRGIPNTFTCRLWGRIDCQLSGLEADYASRERTARLRSTGTVLERTPRADMSDKLHCRLLIRPFDRSTVKFARSSVRKKVFS